VDNFKTSNGILLLGNCLELMPKLPDKCVDMILCDLPYGTTACKWDTVIPFEPLWKEYKRLCRGAIVLTASQPFTSALVMSNVGMFKYELIWQKTLPVGHLNAKKQPMRSHENILMFGKTNVYNPQKTEGHNRKVATTRYNKTAEVDSAYGVERRDTFYDSTERYPTSVHLCGNADRSKENYHPTQKPVALFEYLIKTYTNEGMLVLDNCIGSGTTAVACENLNRRWVGMEQEEKYFEIAKRRIEDAKS
jgi:site-specific DNA-methyltransferase (adenine-specific)